MVGCGAVSEQFYAPALLALEKAGLLSVGALLDPNRDRVRCLQRLFPEASGIADLKDAEAGGEDALAIVASPVRFHAEHTIQALKRGMTVLCEKPMAMNTAQAEAMLEAAATQRQRLAVGHFRRFFPATQTIRDLIVTRVLGEVESFEFSEGGNFNWPAQSASFFKRESGGGGVTIDIGAHAFDLMLWWFGMPSSFSYEDDAMGGIEANCRLSAEFNNGITGEVRLSRDWELPNRYIIHCERGWLSWTVGEAQRVQVRFNDNSFVLDGRLCTPGAGGPMQLVGNPGANYQQSFMLQIRNVIAAMRTGEKLRVPGTTAMETVKLIDACYRNRKLMAMPWLSEAESRRAVELAK